MPQGTPKRKRPSSTFRRLQTARKIKALGVAHKDMSRCSRCKKEDLICYMVKGYARCHSCTEANVKQCDGCFSDAKFDSVEKAKVALREQQEAQRAEVGRLAAAAASAFAALSAAQDKEVQLGKRLDLLTARQSDMLLKELAALDALDAIEDPTPQVALFADPPPSWDDPSEPLEFGAFDNFVEESSWYVLRLCAHRSCFCVDRVCSAS